MKVIGVGEANFATIFTHALMSISVSNLASFSHHILELGPVDSGAQVFNFKGETGAMWATASTATTTAAPGSRA